VPNYNLEKAHEAAPPLQKATTITLKTSLKSIRFRLWDEDKKVFITFKEARQSLRKPQESALTKAEKNLASPRPRVQRE